MDFDRPIRFWYKNKSGIISDISELKARVKREQTKNLS